MDNLGDYVRSTLDQADGETREILERLLVDRKVLEDEIRTHTVQFVEKRETYRTYQRTSAARMQAIENEMRSRAPVNPIPPKVIQGG